MMLSIALALSVAAAAECIAVRSDRITAQNLTEALPALVSVPENAVFGFAPLPGLTRLVHGNQLERFAARYGVHVTATDPICVKRVAGPSSEPVKPAKASSPRPAIVRGQSVPVRVEAGPASLEFFARAETSAAAGQRVVLVNPASGRRFEAVAAPNGAAVVLASRKKQ